MKRAGVKFVHSPARHSFRHSGRLTLDLTPATARFATCGLRPLSEWGPTLPYVIETLIIAAAAALQAGTGMGMALLAAPLLMLVNRALVPGPMLCATMALSIAVVWRERAAIDRRLLSVAFVGLTVGCAIGAFALAVLIGVNLAEVFAIFILIIVALSVLGWQVRATTPSLLLGGAASGVLGTMFGVHGPPIAIVLQHEPPERLRVTLCAFFAVGCGVSLVALAIIGTFDFNQMGLGLALLPGVAIGFVCAPLLARLLNRQRARIAVLTISTLSAVALLLR